MIREGPKEWAKIFFATDTCPLPPYARTVYVRGKGVRSPGTACDF